MFGSKSLRPQFLSYSRGWLPTCMVVGVLAACNVSGYGQDNATAVASLAHAASAVTPPDANPASDAESDVQAMSGYELIFPAMGTQLAFQAFSDDPKRVEKGFGEARLEVERLVEILSDYSTESETVLLSRREKLGEWQATSPELWEVLQICDRWHELSHGAFDASIGQLSVLWRKARKTRTIPTREQIEQALEQCGWQYVELDKDTHRVRINRAGLKLDFGAMGKGYVIDKAYERLAVMGLPIALVRAGGDLRCGDAPPGRQGWPIEIAKLDGGERVAHRLLLANSAVSSSGDLYQFIEFEGGRHSHVIDPKTGIGVPGPRLVTVVAPTSTEADAADTALCVLSDDEALAVAKHVGSIEVRLATVTADQGQTFTVRTTPGFDGLLTP